MKSLPSGYRALVVGASGGIGAAVAELLRDKRGCGVVETLSRRDDGLDLTEEGTIAAAAERLRDGAPFDLLFDATGALTIDGIGPEKTIRVLDPQAMAKQFAVNAIGPALIIKHFLPLLRRDGRAVFATLSAGSDRSATTGSAAGSPTGRRRRRSTRSSEPPPSRRRGRIRRR